MESLRRDPKDKLSTSLFEPDSPGSRSNYSRRSQRPSKFSAASITRQSSGPNIYPYNHNLTSQGHPSSDSDSETEREEELRLRRQELAMEAKLSPTTAVIAVQILDLIHTLFTRATSIYTEWTRIGSDTTTPLSFGADNSAFNTGDPDQEEIQQNRINIRHVWSHCWCPLLQATARLCCDMRREVRTDALTYLQRALLSPILHPLTGKEWEECFDKVMFPLLSGFLESIAMEETLAKLSSQSAAINRDLISNAITFSHTVEFADPRMRAIPLLTKVFLQHLRPLYNSDHFQTLWIHVLNYMERFMQASSSDSLTDAVRESLKNVLLVMCTGTHDLPPILKKDAPSDSPEASLWRVTECHLRSFLPELLEQLFPSPLPVSSSEPEPLESLTRNFEATPISDHLIEPISEDPQTVEPVQSSFIYANYPNPPASLPPDPSDIQALNSVLSPVQDL